MVRGVEAGDAEHLAGQADRADARHLFRRGGVERIERRHDGVPPVLRLLLRPEPLRPGEGKRGARLGDDPVMRIDQDGLRARGAEIDPSDECHRGSAPVQRKRRGGGVFVGDQQGGELAA